MDEFTIAYEETLRRMLVRISMIVQGDKCLFMLYHPETRELVAGLPTQGFDGADLSTLRVRDTDGISGEVFTSNASSIFHDAEADPRAWAERWTERGVHNGVCAPLLIDIRDDETNHLLGRYSVGVLHVFNKRFGGAFVAEDAQILERFAKSVASHVHPLYFDGQGADLSLKAERVDR